jgi:protein-tyrosine phosphatase
MIDLHSHILPGVDDGSEDMEMSIDMARIYLENGYRTVIATPHYIDEGISFKRDKVKDVLEDFRRELDKQGIGLEVLLAHEVYSSIDIVKDIKEGNISTLNNTRYVLVEFPMFDLPLYTENMIYELLLEGYVPIIAHPERNARIIDNPNILYNLILKGALVQMNLPSLEGRYGGKIKETAEILLKHHMVHFLGTDAHSNGTRSPRVDKALSILKSIISEEEYNRLIYVNPRLLLEDKLIKTRLPIEYKSKKHKSCTSKLLRKIINNIFSKVICHSFTKCHSEERSDEESFFSKLSFRVQRGILKNLKTDLGAIHQHLGLFQFQIHPHI